MISSNLVQRRRVANPAMRAKTTSQSAIPSTTMILLRGLSLARLGGRKGTPSRAALGGDSRLCVRVRHAGVTSVRRDDRNRGVDSYLLFSNNPP
jgi:hypothetical protein